VLWQEVTDQLHLCREELTMLRYSKLHHVTYPIEIWIE